uniref:Secreted protein n=1 Tax=Steinernema glaseri TaxID=37863 RepID=A0A1I7YAD0_9BILA
MWTPFLILYASRTGRDYIRGASMITIKHIEMFVTMGQRWTLYQKTECLFAFCVFMDLLKNSRWRIQNISRHCIQQVMEK